ncbi:hypothetical protein FHR32_008665 [Streptosporangium album]|uniref:Uncharacterized protein n=1 Tax=Streptosporangium album TaxID=47479 RepID=A0A7W7S5J1_9ACTN|nr:hypothetical protein [Streptosporangium album]
MGSPWLDPLYNHIPNLRELRAARRPAELQAGTR